MIEAFRCDPRVSYLVDGERLTLDSRFMRTRSVDGATRLTQGGLFSLDGMHPTVTGYALVGQLLLDTMLAAGVDAERSKIDWPAVINADTLLHNPPRLLNDLQAMLRFVDRRGLLSAILDLF